jgi:DnaJ-class molecular chaperone
MPRFKADGYGDLYVKAKVIIPTDLSPDARAAAERFLALAHQPDPRAREN